MAEKHTPTPWKFSPWHIEEGPSAVRSPDGWIVANTSSDANAAFIVRAVNAHDDLISVLTEWLEAEDTWDGDFADDDRIARAKDAARATLSRHGEGKP